MKNKLINYIKSLPTVRKLKKENKQLNERIEQQSIFIRQLEGRIQELSDNDTKLAKIERLEDSLRYSRERVKFLREDNKRLREENK